MLPIRELEQCSYTVRTFMNIKQSSGDTTEVFGTQKRPAGTIDNFVGLHGTTK